jgi:hypothetical protein
MMKTRAAVVNQIPVIRELARLTPRSDAFPRDYHLNIVLVYEDERTHRWSREVLARVREVAGDQSVRSTCWNIADFKGSGVLAGAVSMAMKADIIVTAICETKKMRLPFYMWVESWLPNRVQRVGALVALVGECEENAGETGTVGSYLRAVARKGHLDFLLEKRKLSVETASQARTKNIRQSLARIGSI